MPNRRRGGRGPQAIRREEHAAGRRIRTLSGLLFGAAILIMLGTTLSLGKLSRSAPVPPTFPVDDQAPPAVSEMLADPPAESAPPPLRPVPTPPSLALATPAPSTPQPMPAPPRQTASAPEPPSSSQAAIQPEEARQPAAPVPTPVPTPAPPPLASRLEPSPLPSLPPSPVPVQSPVADCRVGDSFSQLADLVGEATIGRCLENEFVNLTTGDTHQRTSRGLLVWVKTRGVPAFTDGATTWYGCADGVRERWSGSSFPC